MGKRSRPFSVLVALLLGCLFAAVGFRVGQIVRPSTADAASTWQSAAALSYARVKTGAYRSAWQRGFAQGWRLGTSAADSQGERAGRSAGLAEAAARAVAARGVASVLAATPHQLRRGVRTESCVPVAGGLCEVLGPRVTGKPCPPASIPYPEGGAVCIPRVLLMAARATG
jgi:hypothetical protein